MEFEEFKAKSTATQIAWVIEKTRANDYIYLRWFCNLYDPRNYINQDKLESLLGHSLFFSFAINEIAQKCPLEFVLLLRLFARQDVLEGPIFTFGGIRTLCELMRSNILENSEILENACICIGMLATTAQIRKTLAEEGVITILVDLLKRHASESSFITRACRALNNACYKENENKISFVENGGFSLLISFFDSDIDIIAKQTSALLLRNICNLDQDRNYLVDTVPTAIEDVLRIMESLKVDQDVSQIQIHLLWTLLNLTINNSDFKRKVGEKGGCTRILELMKKFTSHVQIQTVACTTLLQLSKKKYNRMAIGKGGGIPIIIQTIRNHSTSETLVKVALDLIKVLCIQGINRKRLTKEEGLLQNIMLTFKENITNRKTILPLLEILFKLANGATNSKYALRSINALPMLSEVITNFTTDQLIRNLANNCISSVFQQGITEEEDSNESWSSESSDDEVPDSDLNGLRLAAMDLDNVEFSLQNLKRALEVEKIEEKSEKQEEQIRNLNAELKNERLLRMKHEEDIKKYKAQFEFKSMRDLELQSMNHQLSKDLEIAHQSIANLLVQNDNFIKEIQNLEAQFELDSELINNLELKKSDEAIMQHKIELEKKEQVIMERNEHIGLLEVEKKQIEQSKDLEKKKKEEYKSELENKDEIISTLKNEKEDLYVNIEKLRKENEKLNKVLANAVDDSLLYHWMTVAIRLDYLMHSKCHTTNFDTDAMYEQFKLNNTDFTTWPKLISNQIMEANKNATQN